VKTATVNASFQKHTAEWRFLKTQACRLREDGRKHDVMHHLLLALRMLCEGCYRISIVFVWMGENDSNTLRVDAYFFANGGTKSPFSKRIGVEGDLKLRL